MLFRAVAVLAGIATAPATAQERPEIERQRWREDWSPLADPTARTRPLDRLKHVPLGGDGDADAYVSLGASLRQRLERNDTRDLGAGGETADAYLLQRLLIHADVHLAPRWRAFVQLEDSRAPGKRMVAPIDANPLDLRLAFADYRGERLTVRAGRQDLDVGRERFISDREGPNVRQSFDAVWAEWNAGPWRYVAFTARPVDHRPGAAFDDPRDDDIRLDSARVSRRLDGLGTLTGWLGLYRDDDAVIAGIAGRERRTLVDLRWDGEGDGWDWDVEAMVQRGRVGGRRAGAWALGGKVGRSFAASPLEPRLALQFDYATGDRGGDRRIGTFNPLFPDGSYFTLADYTGYANLIHLQPSITVTPADRLTLTGAVGLQWRQSLGDAVYVQPITPVAGTAGGGGRWTGAYGRARLDWLLRPEVQVAVEAVRYEIGRTLREAGARDGNYLGLQLAADW